MLFKLLLFVMLKKVLRISIKKINSLSKRYYNNKDDKLQKRRNKYVCFEEFDNRIKSLERKLSVKNKLS